MVVRTHEGEERARATVQRQAAREQQTWEKRLWHLGNQTVACAPDAQTALAKPCQRLPHWFVVAATVVAREGHAARGRPRKNVAPSPQRWQIQATLTRDHVALEREALRRATFVIGTNLVDTAWPDEAVIALYREQTVVARGFAFLKVPLSLATSVFVKRPERIMALALVMALCLLVYKLADVRLRQRLAQIGQTVPDQTGKPTGRPTLRWLVQCFECVDLLHTRQPSGMRATEVLRLSKVCRLVLSLLGSTYGTYYLTFQQTTENERHRHRTCTSRPARVVTQAKLSTGEEECLEQGQQVDRGGDGVVLMAARTDTGGAGALMSLFGEEPMRCK